MVLTFSAFASCTKQSQYQSLVLPCSAPEIPTPIIHRRSWYTFRFIVDSFAYLQARTMARLSCLVMIGRICRASVTSVETPWLVTAVLEAPRMKTFHTHKVRA